MFCSGLQDNQDKWRAAAFLRRGRQRREGDAVCESEKTECRDFAWEKNVDEMNGKRTCPRLRVRKKTGRKKKKDPAWHTGWEVISEVKVQVYHIIRSLMAVVSVIESLYEFFTFSGIPPYVHGEEK